MLSGLNITLTLSKSSDSVDYQYGTTTFQVYCNGELLTDSKNVTVASSDTSWLYVQWSYNTGTVTVTHYQNSFRSDRSAYVTVTYNKVVSPQYTVSQTKMPMTASDIVPVLFDDGVIYQYDKWPSYGSIPQAVQIPTLSNTFVSIRSMNPRLPNSEGDGGSYGGQGYNVGATSASDGKSNTQKLLAYDNTYDTSWQTASYLSTVNSQYIHHAARAAWRWTKANRSNGDWYLPSYNELLAINNTSNYYRIMWTIYELRRYTWDSREYDGIHGNVWSSNERDGYPNQAYYVSIGTGYHSAYVDGKTTTNRWYPFIKP